MQAVITMGATASMQVASASSALEAELRRSKRREEKLAALQYRLREDLKQNQRRASGELPTSQDLVSLVK